MEEACTIERMREDRWASLTECASVQVRKCTGASRISTKVHVCIIPCARRNESEWRRDADRERRQRRCEAQINRRLRTCIRLEERIRILDADFVQFATISGPVSRKKMRQRTQYTLIRAKTRRVIYTYEKMLQKTRCSPRLKRRSCRRDNKRRQWMRFPKQERQGR